ncbi:MAG: hypothetical protein K6U74_00065 [Firmicutes bacterium]|nr:hypothetical protein [Bacillota bacterium]
MHARKQIRDAVVSLLNVAPVNWQLVTPSRIASTRQIWPYLMVFCDGETSSPITVNEPFVSQRSLSVSIVGLLRLPGTGDTQSVEDRMDDLALEVEEKITSAAMRGLVQINNVSLISTVMDVFIEEENIDRAEIKMVYNIVYTTLDGSPSTLI